MELTVHCKQISQFENKTLSRCLPPHLPPDISCPDVTRFVVTSDATPLSPGLEQGGGDRPGGGGGDQ